MGHKHNNQQDQNPVILRLNDKLFKIGRSAVKLTHIGDKIRSTGNRNHPLYTGIYIVHV